MRKKKTMGTRAGEKWLFYVTSIRHHGSRFHHRTIPNRLSSLNLLIIGIRTYIGIPSYTLHSRKPSRYILRHQHGQIKQIPRNRLYRNPKAITSGSSIAQTKIRIWNCEGDLKSWSFDGRAAFFRRRGHKSAFLRQPSCQLFSGRHLWTFVSGAPSCKSCRLVFQNVLSALNCGFFSLSAFRFSQQHFAVFGSKFRFSDATIPSFAEGNEIYIF